MPKGQSHVFKICLLELSGSDWVYLMKAKLGSKITFRNLAALHYLKLRFWGSKWQKEDLWLCPNEDLQLGQSFFSNDSNHQKHEV